MSAAEAIRELCERHKSSSAVVDAIAKHKVKLLAKIEHADADVAITGKQASSTTFSWSSIKHMDLNPLESWHHAAARCVASWHFAVEQLRSTKAGDENDVLDSVPLVAPLFNARGGHILFTTTLGAHVLHDALKRAAKKVPSLATKIKDVLIAAEVRGVAWCGESRACRTALALGGRVRERVLA